MSKAEILAQFPWARCQKHGGKELHTPELKTGRCVECGKAVVEKEDPHRWEVHAAEQK
jgi:hypothetical protein